MYRIGMFSKLGRVTIKTLRHYDEEGLLAPAYVDEENGYRYYTTDQLFRLNKIVALRQMGFSISEIGDIVDGRNVSAILEMRKAELTTELEQAEDRLFRLENYMLEQKEGYRMQYQAVIKEIPACTVFAAEYVLPSYSSLMQVMPALGEKVSEANPGIQCVQPDYCFNVYLDGEYKEHDVHVEICQAVTSRGKDGDGVVFKDLPAVTVASVLHKGDYAALGAAYAYAMQWVEQNGYRITGPVRESYIDGIWNKDSVSDWLTEIQMPVAKK